MTAKPQVAGAAWTAGLAAATGCRHWLLVWLLLPLASQPGPASTP